MINVLREPIVHFWVIGAVLFLTFELFDAPAGLEAEQIVITSGQVENLQQRFARSRQRAPTREELQGLVDEYIREEILYREALLLGLDKGDTVVRGRMRQKMDLMSDSVAELTVPSNEQLQDYIDAHPDRFATEPQVSFHQVFLDPQKRSGVIEKEAPHLLSLLSGKEDEIDIAGLGDSLMLPESYPLTPISEISHQFGEQFSRELLQSRRGQWAGPLQSGYGFHLVLVTDYKERGLPELDEIRRVVEWEFYAARRKEMRSSVYEELREKYIVVFEARVNDELDLLSDKGLADRGEKK